MKRVSLIDTEGLNLPETKECNENYVKTKDDGEV